MHFIFFLRFFLLYSHFFSISHRTCYLEGIVSLLLVWSVYSYVFFLSVLFLCRCSTPSSSKLQQKNRFANSIQLHLPTPSIPPTLPTHPFPLFQPNTTTQTNTKNRAKKRERKTTQPNPNTHTQKPPNSALEYPNYIQTAPNNYSPNSP